MAEQFRQSDTLYVSFVLQLKDPGLNKQNEQPPSALHTIGEMPVRMCQ